MGASLRVASVGDGRMGQGRPDRAPVKGSRTESKIEISHLLIWGSKRPLPSGKPIRKDGGIFRLPSARLPFFWRPEPGGPEIRS
jgi:hypothetical protein